VLTRTDARGITATNTYDALDRLTGTTYPDSTQDVAYHYDEADSVTGCSGSASLGRLTRIVEGAVTTVYCYDPQGHVTRKQQVTASGADTTSYAYTPAGRLSGITYPDGGAVSYARDTDGRIQSISVTPAGGSARTVVSAVTYLPFGPVSSYTLGNGQQITRAYDANYRLTDLTSPAFSLHVARDVMGNLTAMGNSPGANPATERYTYDALNRLTGITEADGSSLESVTYNKTGDRSSKSGSGLATGTYSYNPGTHQLVATGNQARTVDADGNTTGLTQAGSTYSLGYNDRNRLATVQTGTTTVGTYTYNALGQRIQKVTSIGAERFDYDEASQLLAEAGTTNRDNVWMDGIPVATIDTQSGTSTISYVTADQLGTPRVISDAAGTTKWSWPYAGNAWGEIAPTTNGYTFNLRFPGQYYDQETGLADNGYRTLDASVGGYVQPDPLGLFSGQPSIYPYVSNNPLHFVDSLGLYQQTEELDPRASEALNTPETNVEIKALDEAAAEAERAQGAVSYIAPRPASEFGELGHCDAIKPTESYVGPPNAPNFIVTPDGTVYPVPEGATGPEPTRNGRGMQFQGGSGGNGLSPRTTGFRFMDPVTSGSYQYPNGYGSYNNSNGQAVNPYTGSANISKTDPMWHIAPGGSH
jgi:RHS repeat-associated protein